jgi:two-component system NarL family sensor kinase
MKDRLLLILALTCLMTFRSKAQGIDTLWKDNPTISDSAKLELLGETCFNLVWEDTAKSRIICEEMLRLTPGCDNMYAKVNSYRTAGIIYQELEKYNEALENYNKAINLVKNLNDNNGRILNGKALSNLGLFYHKNGDFQSALNLYLKADSLLEPFDLYSYKINNYSKISDVYDHLGQVEQCEYYYKKIVELAENAKDTFSIVTSDNIYALFAMGQHNYDLAKVKMLHCLDLSIKLKNSECIFSSYFNLCELEWRQNHLTKAIPYIQKAEEIAREWGNNYYLCRTLYKRGAIYYFLDRFKDAHAVIEESITVAREHEYNDLLKQSLEIAILIEDTLGNYKKALIYNKEYDQLLKNTTDLEVRKTINFLDAKYQAEKREIQITNLESQQKIQLLRISRNRLWIILLIVLVCLLAAGSILMTLNYRYKKKITLQEVDLKKQKIIELEKERQIVAANAALQGEESERSRLARDLHDGLGGLLSGIKFKLNHIKGNFLLDNSSKTDFENTLELLDSSVKELRRVAHNMMPEALIKLGLKDAISDFCSEISNPTIQVDFRFYGENRRIDQKIEISSFRIIQELVNNALKHSEASQIVVQIVQEVERLSISVQDNGKGFDLKKIETNMGIGLSSIKSRVAAHNGTIDINTEPGKGTEIQVEFGI